MPVTLAKYLAEVLDPIDTKLSPAICSAYGLDETATVNTAESTKAVLDLATDICFALGARAFAGAWSRKPGAEAFLYRFNVPNPWEGPWKGHATHILDIAFGLQNYREHLEPGQQKSEDRFARDIISFVNGGSPWHTYQVGAEQGAMVYYAAEDAKDDESRYVRTEDPRETGRRVILQDLLDEQGLDKVMSAWEMFMKGPKV